MCQTIPLTGRREDERNKSDSYAAESTVTLTKVEGVGEGLRKCGS